ncbi:SDR family oxidoreductase [Streptomyces sp. NPDC004629]|uniref:SDR family oxidoreductase n=1 Tax=Streptomyces sp. NPDC004629 TaxID=3364705 RepID=UPI0036777122
MTDQQRKTVLVTGGSSGFGRAALASFLAQGWNVAATARQPSAQGQQGPADNLLVCAMDVRDADSVAAAVERAVERFGRLDCVVNNAGAGLLSVFEATPMTAVRELFETNVFGMMRVTHAVLPYFAAQGEGRVVNVSSGSGIVPEPLMSVYAATKFAVEGFTESLRYELAIRNVVVKLVEPGLVPDTNFVQRTAETSRAVPVPPAYEGYVRRIVARFQEDSPYRLATEGTVADAIVTAASDNTTHLRYVVGEDTEVAASMRRETSEKDYNNWALSTYTAG